MPESSRSKRHLSAVFNPIGDGDAISTKLDSELCTYAFMQSNRFLWSDAKKEVVEFGVQHDRVGWRGRSGRLYMRFGGSWLAGALVLQHEDIATFRPDGLTLKGHALKILPRHTLRPATSWGIGSSLGVYLKHGARTQEMEPY
jgi:hypothetical protein